MNPPSPFTAIQAIQEEQREGWTMENKTATAMNIIEEISRAKYERSIVRIAALPPGLRKWSTTPWDDLSEAEKDVARSATRETIDDYLSNIGDEMPGVEDMHDSWSQATCKKGSTIGDGWNAVRNLLLSAFAKKMEAITKLPQRWRDDNEGQGLITMRGCAYELEKALGSLPVEPVPEVPADPYAHLKLAWANKRRIRTRRKGSDGWSEWNQPGDVVFYWNLPPECYEIEPLPADKWAKEKAAHAQGKRIERREGNQDWQRCLDPQWFYQCEYRIAPDPAPAGKLTDVQLGEIGAKAASGKSVAQPTIAVAEGHGRYHYDEPARTAFAAAVREAVEKEQSEEIQNLTCSAMKAWEEADRAKSTIAELTDGVRVLMEETPWGANNETQEQWLQRQREKANTQAEEIARLTAELEIFKKIRDSKLELQSKYDDLQVTMDSVTMNANWSIERMKEAEHKLATIEVRLGEIAALPQKWRSRPAVMSWNPAIDCIFELEAALLPRPTAEAVSKADFERFARGEGYSLAKNAKDEFRDTAAIHGWKLWQAARAAKEGEK